mmetsp:Transcript_5562/g.9195  ORF Transcript_5562/g.9195 Transcript_5562/m.9195 type:complete len:171 (-) Transcript_5562:41-553(-)
MSEEGVQKEVEEGKKEVKCFNCNGNGHIAKTCASNRGVLQFAKDPVECRLCSGKGHFARVCTSRDANSNTVCYKCGKYYHKAFECRTPVRGYKNSRGRGRGRGGIPVSKEDFTYDSKNSVSSRGSRGRGRGGRGRRGAKVSKSDDTSKALCYVCNEYGHLSYDCSKSDSQ